MAQDAKVIDNAANQEDSRHHRRRSEFVTQSMETGSMSAFKNGDDFNERLSTAAKARQASLEKFRARFNGVTSSGFPFLELIQPAAVRRHGHLIVYGLPRPSVTCSVTSSSNGALSIGFQPSSGGPRIEHFLGWRRRSASEAPGIDSACTGPASRPCTSRPPNGDEEGRWGATEVSHHSPS